MTTSNPGKPNAANCRVSIVIKALNEEKRIEAAVESALRAVSSVGGEVILADSCSSDRTVELASRYPIRIVQLALPQERCCGIGPQLGYQHSAGEYVYIMDGDMEMLSGFLEPAIEFMEKAPQTAGVGGLLIEKNTESLEYIARAERTAPHMQVGGVDRLDGGGLYRRSAIDQSGHFSNRNLHSYEEFDLAVRLRAAGWTLQRLPVPAVNHTGHDAPPYQLLMRRWRSRYICGLGELIRASYGKPHFRLVLKDLRELRLYAAVILWWLILASVLAWPVDLAARSLCFAGLLLAPLALMTWRKRSLTKAFFSVVSWNVNTAGLVRGMTTKQSRNVSSVASKTVREPATTGIPTANDLTP